MARIINEEQYSEKRNEILNVAQRLVYTRGYEQMSIQEIINELQISKGAFYHYFSSKQDLLEALIERSLDQVMDLLTPVIEDPALSAPEKFNRYFATAGQWKTGQKAYILAILEVWYADKNAIVRQKTQSETIRRIAPVFRQIIQQGIKEGTLTTSYPEQAGEVLLSLLVGFGENMAAQMLKLGLVASRPAQANGASRSTSLRGILDTAAAYTAAMERVLGAPPGSIELINSSMLAEWFDDPPPPVPPVRADLSAAGG